MIRFFRGCWIWKSQVFYLAKIDLVKTCRGAVLGWIWLFAKPAIYIAVFWLALRLGLRQGSSADYPYIIWLASGIIPWFYMQSMVVDGCDVYRRYTYLVNKIKFPLPAISAFYSMSQFYIYLMSMAIFFIACLISGYHFSIYLLQLPLIMIFMYIFFTTWSIFSSPLSAISKDLSNLIKTLGTPLFWLSGIIFNLTSANIGIFNVVMLFNPVTFFVEATRWSTCTNMWFWENPTTCYVFLGVMLVTIIAALLVYNKLKTEVADVL